MLTAHVITLFPGAFDSFLAHSLLAKAGFDMQPFSSQIIPLHIGDNMKAVNFSKLLLERYRILAPAIRPPTVPEGSARLRLTVTLGHSRNNLEYTAEAIAKLANGLNII